MIQPFSFKKVGAGLAEINAELNSDIWQLIKNNIISKNMDNKPLLMWLEPTTLIEVEPQSDSHCFKLSVPTELHKYWISNNLLEVISSEISAIHKSPFLVELIVTGHATPTNNDEFDRLTPVSASPIEDAFNSVKTPRSTSNKDTLNPELTFSTFVVGRNNEFAHAVSYSIAENPGTENYNPLFICGPTGMGKTHLLNAVGNYVRLKFPHLTICYCSAERFLNECISAIRRGEMHKFRMRYREQCQILLMDDIQILGRGEAVQEEFFHTLNYFFEKGQQVIVASDRMPKDILGLEDRIRTRLEWGLIADIQMPDIETRVAILRYKAERRGMSLPQDVVSYVARISKRSIRELEGNLNKIKMYAELQAKPITLELARKVLATHDDTKHITMDEIQKLVADHFKVRVIDLKAKARTQPLVTARQVAMFMVKKHLDKSLVEIGRNFGGRDHTTVLNAMHRIESQLIENSDLKRDFDEIETRIHNITGV
jgi:chromosomal replication initiator protein